MRAVFLPALILVLPIPAAVPEVRAAAAAAPQGGVLALRAPGPGPLKARLGERDHPFFPAPGGKGLAVLVPVPLDSPLGAREVVVEGEGGATRVPFRVTASRGPVLKVKVPPSKTELSAGDQARAAREQAEFQAITASPGAARAWEAPFGDPGGGAITCEFGATRRFNGTVTSVHKGLDLRAATGTPVKAAAAGTVRLAKDVFFGGNLVFVDHGCGLFTSYAHLSRLDAKPGQAVRAGERLGLSGATGRVSGPHLHWGASISGVQVDPRLVREGMAYLCGEAPARAPKRPRKRR